MITRYRYTTKGLALNASAALGTAIHITKAEYGNGASEDLVAMEQLSNSLGQMTITHMEMVDGNAVLNVLFTNAQVETGFDLTQIGVFAKGVEEDGTEGEEILYLIGQATTPDTIPPISQGNVQIQNQINCTFSNDVNLTVDFNPNGLATQSQLAQKLDKAGGTMSGTLTMSSGVNLFLEGGSGLFGQRYDGTTMQLIGLGNTENDNLYVGSTSTTGTKHTGNTYLCVGANKGLYAVIGDNYHGIYHEGNRMKTKLLWSGSWNTGSITVPGLSDYTVFYVDVATAGTGILAVKETDFFRGGNLYTDTSGTTYMATIAATVSGGQLTYINCHSRSITTAGVVGPGEAGLAVAAIYGVI